MSIQPSLPSDYDTGPRRWQELLELDGILSSQYHIINLLDFMSHVFEEKYACSPCIWLDAACLGLLKNADLSHPVLVSKLTPVMEQAWQEKRVVHGSRGTGGTMAVAIPLTNREQFLGVIELKQPVTSDSSGQNPDFRSDLISQMSHAIYLLGHLSQHEYLRRKIANLTAIEDISRSILSNLDRESQANSILSLIRLKFGFPKATLVIPRAGANHTFRMIQISEEGIKIEPWQPSPDETDPVSWSISNLEPLIINNYAIDERFDRSPRERNVASEAVFPLINGEMLTGILVLGSESVDSFGPETLLGFQLLAQNICLAIRNAELYYFEQARRSTFDDLQRVFGAISPELTIESLLQKLLNQVEEIIPCDAAAIWLVEHSSGSIGVEQSIPSLHLGATWFNESTLKEIKPHQDPYIDALNDPIDQNASATEVSIAQYRWMDEILESKIALVKNDSPGFEPLGIMLGFKDGYSAIGAPLLLDGQAVGVIILANHLSEQYGSDTQFLIDVISQYAAILIENTRLYGAAHNQAWIATVLLQLSEAIQSVDNLDDLLQTVADILPGLFDVDACQLYLWDQSLEAFFPQASSGFNTELSSQLNSWNIYPGSVLAFDQLIKTNLPVILDDKLMPDDMVSQLFADRDFDRDLLILFPMIAQGGLDGAILVDFTNSTLKKDSSQDIWDEKYTLIQGAARQTAITLENLQLIKSQEEEAYISVALLQVAQAIVSLTQLDEILASIVRITPILVGVKRCIVYLWDNKAQVFQQSESFGISKTDIGNVGQVFNASKFPFIEAILKQNQIMYHPLGRDDSPLIWNVITSNDSYVVAGNSSDPDGEASITLDAQSLINHERLLVGFPLSIKGELLGVMLVEEEDPIKGSPSLHIREKRIEIVRGISQQAAIAIKNELLQQEAVKSETMERELQLAREIQTTFLPEKLPDFPAWDIAASWQPARQVGGDFYDILQIDDEHIGFVMADVADKGMPAALFMTLIRTLIRAAAKGEFSPSEVLKQVNTLLIPDAKHGMFVTVFYAVITLSSGDVVYANAGHNPPIVRHIDGSGKEELTRTSIALGIFEDILVDEREVSLQSGDWLLLYTDGVTEAFSASEEMFGVDRLYQILEDYEFISSKGLVTQIEQSVNEFIKGVDLSDDMTLAVIYRKPG